MAQAPPSRQAETETGPRARGPGLSAPDRARFLACVAAAAPPPERAAATHFAVATTQDPERLAARARAWVDAAARGDEPAFGRLLVTLGRDRAEWECGLRDVTIRDPDRPPGWAVALEAFLAAQPDAAPGDPAEANPARAASHAYRRAATRLLEPLAARAPVALAPQATTQLAGQLADRLMRVTARALEFELQVAGAAAVLFDPTAAAARAALPMDREGWLSRLESLPGLAYVVGVTCHHWRAATAELFDRLRADLALLGDALWAGRTPARLTGVRGDAGDPHDGGRSVALLTFDETLRVVYKSKDLRGAAALVELVARLNPALPLALPVRVILPRAGYGWEEHVAAAECRSGAEVERFYVRMGMTIRLLQLLEARDFWLDNLIACGELPVFVDLETVLQPRYPAPPSLTAGERAMAEAAAESVAPIGAVALPMPIAPGRRGEDIGALSHWRVVPMPLRADLPALAAGGAALDVDGDGHLMWTPPAFAPVLDGRPVDPARHYDQVVEGYRRMQEALRRSRARLAEPGGPLARLATLPVRTLWRSTWDCHAIVQESVGPVALGDGVERDVYFARLFRATLEAGSPPAAPWIVAREIEALRDGDVPLFLATPDGDAVRTTGGATRADCFDGTAGARLWTRVAALDGFDTEAHVGVLRSCLATAAHLRGDPPRPVARVPARAVDDWLARAVAIGDDVRARGRWGPGPPDEDLVWFGLVHHPLHDLLRLEMLPTDLLSGTCGLAILFADLFAATGAVRFAAAARAALRPAGTALASAFELAARLGRQPATQRRPALPCGAFVGAGGILSALQRAGRALGAADLAGDAARAAAAVPVPLLVAASPPDVVSGVAGLLLAVTALEPAGQPAAVRRVLVAHLAGVAAGAGRDGDAPPSPYPPGCRLLDGLPGAREGIALALARAGAGGAPRAPAGAGAGALLAALAHRAGDPGPGLDAFLARDPGALPSLAVVDALEVALAAFRRTGAGPYLARARELGGLLVARREATGTWFPEGLGDDRHNLSLVRGVAAVAHAFLQLHDPGRTRSVRTLD